MQSQQIGEWGMGLENSRYPALRGSLTANVLP